MTKKHNPIRCFEGSAQPYEPFWSWNVRNAADEGAEPELEFYGFISEFSWFDDDITPRKFREELAQNGNGGPITIRIHSGGGELFAASAIASTLADYPGRKTVIIDGLAASAAVMVALAGDKVKIHDTAYMMVHNPSYGFLLGYLDADTLLNFADKLELMREGMLDAYSNRTGLAREVLSKMLDDETWMTAEQAVDLGFADRVIKSGKKARKNESASIENALKNYVNVPPALLNLSSVEAAPVDTEELEAQAQRLRTRIEPYFKKEQEHGSETL